MLEESSPIAIIPSECFRWQPRVQFIESFRSQAAALNFAFQHDYNLIVERNDDSCLQFDVMQDPNRACTAGLDLELLKTEDVLVEPSSMGWTALLLRTLWNLTRRLAALFSKLYAKEIVPFSRRAAAALASLYFREIVPLARRFAVEAAKLYAKEIVPFSRRVVPVLARQYFREIASCCRRASSRLWWSDSVLGFRRMWNRHSNGTVLDLARRFSAIGSLHIHLITLRLRLAAGRYRWADVEAAIHHVSASSLSICRSQTRLLVAAVTRVYLSQIVPLARRTAAFANRCFQGIMLLYRRTAPVVSTHVQKIALALRRAGARCLSTPENPSGRHGWAVAAPRHSNASHIH